MTYHFIHLQTRKASWIVWIDEVRLSLSIWTSSCQIWTMTFFPWSIIVWKDIKICETSWPLFGNELNFILWLGKIIAVCHSTLSVWHKGPLWPPMLIIYIITIRTFWDEYFELSMAQIIYQGRLFLPFTPTPLRTVETFSHIDLLNLWASGFLSTAYSRISFVSPEEEEHQTTHLEALQVLLPVIVPILCFIPGWL